MTSYQALFITTLVSTCVLVGLVGFAHSKLQGLPLKRALKATAIWVLGATVSIIVAFAGFAIFIHEG